MVEPTHVKVKCLDGTVVVADKRFVILTSEPDENYYIAKIDGAEYIISETVFDELTRVLATRL